MGHAGKCSPAGGAGVCVSIKRLETPQTSLLGEEGT